MTVGEFGTSVGDELYQALAPLADTDASLGHPLRAFTRAIGSMLEEPSWYARDTDTEPGWARLVNVDETPVKALGWLAQFVGVTLDPALDDATQRMRIRQTDGFKRGTVGALVGAAQPYLTGAQTVIVRERDGDPYTVTVVTYTAETPDSTLVQAALTAQKPAGLILNYVVETGQDWSTLVANHATWAAVTGAYPTWNDVLNN